MTGSTNRQEADLCNEAARRARHGMCRVHRPSPPFGLLGCRQQDRALQSERFEQLLHTRRGV